MRRSLLKFEVENLGPLATGAIDLAELTVICGENNTGKSYLTYTLYGLLKMLDEFIELPEFDIPTLSKTGVLEIDLQALVVSRASEIIEGAVNRYRKNLYSVLSAPNQLFNETKLTLALDFNGILTKEYHGEFTSDLNRRIISFVKPENSSILTVTAFNEENHESKNAPQYQNLISRVVTAICFRRAIPTPFILSAERTGTVIFQGDLNVANSRWSEVAGQTYPGSPRSQQLFEQMHQTNHGYPLPIRDNLNFINSLASLQDQESALLKTHPEILHDFEDLIGGNVQIQNYALYFVPKGMRGRRLRMSESSSAVRSLILLGFYLKHLAAPGALLMIDEPELNLHPANQRKLARLLVRLVNVGVSVFVTTHSDYIVKEFNTLIMWHTRAQKDQSLPKDPRYSDKDSLDPEKVRVYISRQDRVHKNGHTRRSLATALCEADINDTFGIEVPSFDETINDMNALQESLYYGTPYTRQAGT